MRTFLFGLLLCGLNSLFAQQYLETFAIINDPDGYTNVRSGPESQYKAVAKILKGEIFFVEDAWEDTDWKKILFYVPTQSLLEDQREPFSAQGRTRLSGYMHKSRIQLIRELEEIPASDITVRAKEFVLQAHRIRYEEQEGNFAPFIFIDGNDWAYGTDASIPKTEYASLQVEHQGKVYGVPSVILKQYFEPNPKFYTAWGDDQGNVYIYSLNGDGAGGYFCTFSFSPQGLVHHSGWRLI